jgi:phosphohistidine phosphatase
MKRIMFVRHARAEELYSGIDDFERSLTPKGKISSGQMARLIREKEKGPVLIITSPAFRAYETAVIFARILKYNPDSIILKDDLYSRATLNSFFGIVENTDNEINTMILFGHNPSLTEIADRLSKDGCDFLPKCGIVCLSFKTETWKGIVHEKGKIEYFLKPEKTHE